MPAVQRKYSLYEQMNEKVSFTIDTLLNFKGAEVKELSSMCFRKANKNQKIICGALQGSMCTGGCCRTCRRKQDRGIERA